MNQKLKRIIFDKLYQDLKHVEIIPHDKSIWFIDREKKCWYFEYEKSKILFWKYHFFIDFFKLFSLEQNDFEPIISEWVEEVLNYKVVTTFQLLGPRPVLVEEVLNYKVVTTHRKIGRWSNKVEEVLNYKVVTTCESKQRAGTKVEEVLNSK